MAWCPKHGINNPECRCNPFGGAAPVPDPTHEGWEMPVGAQTQGGSPAGWRVAVVANDITSLQMMALVLHMVGYRTILQIEGEFRTPLQRYPRQLVYVLWTNASMSAIMNAIMWVIL